MTPEEIEELRAMVARLGRLDATGLDENLAVILGAALEHIDQQAASLDEAEALTRKNAELMNGYMARIAELETTIREKDDEIALLRNGYSTKIAQVTTLREIAVDERAKRIYKGRFRSLNFELPVDRNTHIVEARRQLAKEHPEAFR